MALGQTIACQKREIKSKGYLNQMKRKDFVPGIIYGQGQEAVPIFMVNRELTRILEKHGSNGLFALEMEGETQPAMALIKEVQKHPISGKVIHVDFQTVNMNEKIHGTVAVHLHGEGAVIARGGILQAGAKEVDVTCMPKDLPESFVVDISEMDIGQKVVVGDLTIPAGVEITSDPDIIIATILAPSRAAVETQEESEGEAEAEAQAAE